MGANDTQVGGDHYRRGQGHQHWDLVEINGLGYLEGCATKYLTRWREKGGVQDLEKAHHYTQKLLELHLTRNRMPRGVVPSGQVLDWCKHNEVGRLEANAILGLCRWNTQEDLEDVLVLISQLMEEQPPTEVNLGNVFNPKNPQGLG